jgi:hypothetical protein
LCPSLDNHDETAGNAGSSGPGASERTPLLGESAQYGANEFSQSTHRELERQEQARREAALKEIVWFTGENLIDSSSVGVSPQLVDRPPSMIPTDELRRLLATVGVGDLLPKAGGQLSEDERNWLLDDMASGIDSVLAKYPQVKKSGDLVRQFE